MKFYHYAVLATAICIAAPAVSQDIKFGDDSGEWTNDGECDDRRFFGSGMAEVLNWEDTGRDATDCKQQFDAGNIQLWNIERARAATQCSAINFGDNSGQYTDDGACDDRRFEGIGAAEIMNMEDVEKDANDCQRLCDFDLIYLRDY
ncbi:hypothetical protein [Parasulfitobacter algicola]|uniref:Secreted protein n=1 Tax=Parasulfitobacter algicola TaxID=2614809 RepID=A0ABX2IKL0_9RHOB|nr:hypothetical protein [Sulfitobacter algicola]NSX53404.1 hypothetical protein [Sulfitobacter algicola]